MGLWLQIPVQNSGEPGWSPEDVIKARWLEWTTTKAGQRAFLPISTTTLKPEFPQVLSLIQWKSTETLENQKELCSKPRVDLKRKPMSFS